jgi:predicted CXXCH cytochrome family protein
MRKGRTRRWPLGLLSAGFIVSLTGLLTFALAIPEATKKPPSFPLNLFSEAKAEDYIDEEDCTACHADAHASFQRSPHALYVQNPRNALDKRGCQSCHGPGGPHVAHLKEEDDIYKYVISYTKAKPMESATACLRCHNDTLTMAHWRRTGHARANVTCTDCHQMHWEDRLGRERAKAADGGEKEAAKENASKAVKNTRAPAFIARPEPKALLKADEATLCGSCHRRELTEFRHNFHHPVPEGRMVCSDCHDVHPNRDERKRLRPVKENCVTCHPETAGPFVFEHDPVAGWTGEGCMECHRPHGSHNPALLTTFSRGLCNQCHTDKANNHFPGRTCWQSGCHAAVHGSNHDQTLFRP